MAIVGGVAAGVGAIGGAAIEGSAAQNAAEDQEQAAENATQAQLQMFNTTQANFKPQIELGQGASNLLASIYGVNNGGNGTANYANFYNSPGYQFTVQQGQNAINKQAAANGNLYSTSTLGALSAYNTGQASTQYNSYVNQLLTMAGLGNAAASGVGTAATATGQGMANNANLAGSAAAAGTLGQANAFTNALGGSNSGLLGALSGAYGNSYSEPYTGNPSAPYASNPSNLGGATEVAPAGGSLMYDQYGNILGSSASDRALKTAIVPYGFNEKSGLMAYEFEWKGKPGEKQFGYIAQEVEELYPDAVSRGPKGYLRVDYSALPGWDELDRLSKEHSNG